ncbi:Swarming motility protein YbiA [Novipirellula aureliae]|uniref:Swarming motility protein YbiA n=1 Tax=Novipirellula aureliae TaxID=2527966 RepID=A0A5C6DR72_9BACT|nr:NADAR family protein [Novipirellula aureliae]TWU38684.1 Swarming motility protein YbiA [Novipirellula aureliae]
MPCVAPSPVCAQLFPAAEDQILIRRVAEPGGWLSNMSPHPIVYEGLKWWHAEALFQALRLAPDDEAREAVREPRSPMMAKMIAKRFRTRHVVAPLSEADVENMRLCLALKLDAHADLRGKLIASGERLLVEDCSARGRRVNNLFWGAVRVQDEDCPLGYAWEGRNMLGRLWKEERAMLQTLIS